MTVNARAIPNRPATLVALVAAILCACTAAARDGAVTLSAGSITTAERLTLDVAFTVSPGWTLEPWAESARAALEDAGWTVVRSNVLAPRLWAESPATEGAAVDGALVHRARFVVEPFLPGSYRVPAIEATATSTPGRAVRSRPDGNAAWRTTARPDPGSDGLVVTGSASMRDQEARGDQRALAGSLTAARTSGQPVTLSTDPITIEVASVLPEDEPLQLPLPIDPAALDEATSGTDDADAPLGVLRAIPDEPARRVSVLALVGAGVALLGAAIAIMVALRGVRELRAPKTPDPVRELERLTRRADPDLAEVDAQLRALARRPAAANHAALTLLIDRIERVRYAPEPAGDTPSAIADEAARVARLIDRMPVYGDAGTPGIPRKGAPA